MMKTQSQRARRMCIDITDMSKIEKPYLQQSASMAIFARTGHAAIFSLKLC